ncbi:TnsD family Tn7-like transposition protein [Ralstonia thomasii]
MGFAYDVASAKQVLTAHPGPPKVRASTITKRERSIQIIEQYLREHTTALRTQVKAACGGAWRWLYRYDRTWLDANAPPPVPRGRRYVSWVDWERRDATLVDLIDGKQCGESLSPTARITPRTVLRTMGRLPFSVQLKKMPRAMAKLTEIAEQIKRERD